MNFEQRQASLLKLVEAIIVTNKSQHIYTQEYDSQWSTSK
jgi:hypothetical protein